jgi:mannose-6-phosphate isomerase-like protein (cupin superfamily)
MRAPALIFASVIFAPMIFASAAAAQTSGPAAPDLKTFSSSSDVVALIAKAKADLKPGAPMASEPILLLPPYRASLEYRVAAAPAAVHEKEAELMYVIDGSGTLVTGGKLTGETRRNATNLSGTGIEGGLQREIAKGDFIFVPENTPHWFSGTDGGALILMTLHVPRPVP